MEKNKPNNNQVFYQDRKSKESYQAPYFYDKKDKCLLNKDNLQVAYINLAHSVFTLEKDRNAFGELICNLLNNQENVYQKIHQKLLNFTAYS